MNPETPNRYDRQIRFAPLGEAGQQRLASSRALVCGCGALGTGVLTSNNSIGLVAAGAARVSLGSLPLSLIPTFAVPLWTIFHIVSLLQLARAGGAVSTREAAFATPSI